MTAWWFFITPTADSSRSSEESNEEEDKDSKSDESDSSDDTFVKDTYYSSSSVWRSYTTRGQAKGHKEGELSESEVSHVLLSCKCYAPSFALRGFLKSLIPLRGICVA